MNTVLLIMFALFGSPAAQTNTILQPEQALTGPGGQEYTHAEVDFQDYGKKQDGYWVFQPQAPVPKEAPVVVFLHGYSAYNPMVYGAFIEHLVRKGNVVIFPRYQKNLISPSPDYFVPNTVTAIKNALEKLEGDGYVNAKEGEFYFAGHSFGGLITANILTELDSLDIPKPKAALLICPGVGPFEKVVKESYKKIPSDINLVMITAEKDFVVGDGFANRVFATATETKNRIWFKQFSDDYGLPKISSDHLEVYAKNAAYDTGDHGYSYRRAMTSKIDVIDYNVYWRALDALIECSDKKPCDLIFGEEHEFRNLGNWSDGTPIKALGMLTPTTS